MDRTVQTNSPPRQGESTVKQIVAEEPAAAPPRAPVGAAPGAPSRRTGRRIAAGLMALIALAAIAGGAYGLWVHTSRRSHGYVMTSSRGFATGTYGLATRTLDVPADVPSFVYRHWLGAVRISGTSADPRRPLFIGIARKADVDRYLGDVAHSDVVGVDAGLFGTMSRPTYQARSGGRPAMSPVHARFWAARAAGPGTQALTWRVKEGRWAVVVMRPDGSRGVSADLAAGAKLPPLLGVSIGLLVLGVLGLTGAAALIGLGERQRRHRTPLALTTEEGTMSNYEPASEVGVMTAAVETAPRPQAATTAALIELAGVHKVYRTGKLEYPALRGVDLEIRDGDMVAIVGPSGSGKSTIMNMITGIDRPTSGTVTVDGQRIDSMSEEELAVWRGRRVGVVFQFFQLLPTLTAIENAMLPLDFSGRLAKRDRPALARHNLDLVGLADKADHLPSELSGGEQQRVAIARALAADPPLLIGDEPTGNLDTRTAAEMLDLLGRLNAEGTTVVYVTHDLELAARAHRTVTIRDGVVAAA